jgi:RimJ/RimL family protein N-acetyltransferase
VLLLDPARRRALRQHLPAERPGPLVAPHVLETGQGACFVDRWPEPRVIVAEVADNFSLVGDPSALSSEEVAARVAGFIDASPEFVPWLREAWPGLLVWDRVIFDLDREPDWEPIESVARRSRDAVRVRRLEAHDDWQVFGLGSDVGWISKTQGGPASLARSGLAWGGFVDGRLASVATPFYVGSDYEDVGVVTEAAFRGLGLSPACACGVVRDVLARGRRVSWSTSPDNLPSLAVAQRLGFREQRRDFLYVAGEPLPEPSRKDDA